MPRPKVHPSNRIRAPEACARCKSTKKRCSFIFPCFNCTRAGVGGSCSASSKDRGGRYTTHTRHTGLRTRTTPRGSPTPALRREQYGGVQSTYSGDAGQVELPESQLKTHPRMLRSLQGEKVYIGDSASISFLQLLRDTVAQSLGPSQFSHNAKTESMLESKAQVDNPSFSESILSSDRKLAFVRAYDVATSGFIHVISKPEALQLLERPMIIETTKDSAKMAVKDLILAIGAQCCAAEPLTTRAENFYFIRGQRHAFAGMLEDPSLDLVRAFTLMSFYLLGACRRNATFMYLGIASRAAVALGLHNGESYSSIPLPEQQKRSRVWMSLCVLDRLVSAILGRPSTTSFQPLDARTDFFSNVQRITRTDRCLDASYTISTIISEIVSKLYDDKAVSVEAAEILLEKLTLWKNEFSQTIEISSSVNYAFAQDQESVLGSLNISCLYYFAVTLVTRPFLVSILTAQAASLQAEQRHGSAISSLGNSHKHFKLASACVDSAMYMIQTTVEVHQAGLLLSNMCMLKAFIFAAALILGFSMFTKRETDLELESSFDGARDVLEMLSSQSAQAAHYFEILTLLSNAITKQRQSLALQSISIKSKNPYVGKIFSLNIDRTASEAQLRSSLSEEQSTSRADNGGILDPWLPGDQAAYEGLSQEIGNEFMLWDCPELSAWDSFPFLSDVFTAEGQESL